jgi:hypothetical protein
MNEQESLWLPQKLVDRLSPEHKISVVEAKPVVITHPNERYKGETIFGANLGSLAPAGLERSLIESLNQHPDLLACVSNVYVYHNHHPLMSDQGTPLTYFVMPYFLMNAQGDPHTFMAKVFQDKFKPYELAVLPGSIADEFQAPDERIVYETLRLRVNIVVRAR